MRTRGTVLFLALLLLSVFHVHRRLVSPGFVGDGRDAEAYAHEYRAVVRRPGRIVRCRHPPCMPLTRLCGPGTTSSPGASRKARSGCSSMAPPCSGLPIWPNRPGRRAKPPVMHAASCTRTALPRCAFRRNIFPAFRKEFSSLYSLTRRGRAAGSRGSSFWVPSFMLRRRTTPFDTSSSARISA